MKCKVEMCDRTDLKVKWGLCKAHDQRRRRGADLNSPILDRRRVSWPDCTIEGCLNRAESKAGKRSTVCPTHAGHIRQGKEPELLRQQGVYKVCQVPGCENPFRSKKFCNKHDVRRRNYNLSTDRFLEIIPAPCQICGETSNIHIDHDHSCCPGEQSCGKCVRGSLCSGCNLGLGAFRDSVEKLEQAVRYLSDNRVIY